jgi:hypothetical protein
MKKPGERGQSQAMDKAEALILAGKTPAEAAKKAGVQRNSIYRRPWYKEFVKTLRETE